MNRNTQQTSFWSSITHRFTALLLLSGWLSGIAYTQTALTDFPTGVRNSRGPRALTQAHLQILQQTLRQKTGFVELGFDEQGKLTLGNRTQVRGGSATARKLLAAAVDGASLYELANYNDTPEVAFAQIKEWGEQKNSLTEQRGGMFQVQLDFADFDRLGGAREARASFDLGFALLHEFVHGVMQLADPASGANELGACDTYVNQMRRELQMPERQFYHPHVKVVRLQSGMAVFAVLNFADASKQYELIWRVNHVAPEGKNVRELQQGLLLAEFR